MEKIRYEGSDSSNDFAYKYYDRDRLVLGKKMKDHLKFALSYWHTMCGSGQDMFGANTVDKSFGGTSPMDIAKKKVYACFELMSNLGIEYFCFHDRDIAPEGSTLAESNANLDKIVGIIKDEMTKHDIKLLWGTANLFNHPRYMHGAATSPCSDIFAYAMAQAKKALEVTVELGGSGFVVWGGREGYDTLLNTNYGLEQENLARFLKMLVGYGHKIGFEGDFYIEPKPKEPTKHQYDFDTSTVLAFLRKYNLDKAFKINIESNHATLAGHTMQHELRVAIENDVFGSIDANQGDILLGWDTDQFPTNIYDATLCMYEVLKAGGFTNGGLNFDAKNRRGSNDWTDVYHAYISGMDTFAKGLLLAEKMISAGTFDDFVSRRYESYNAGIGKKIIDNDITIEELEAYALALSESDVLPPSGRQELLESKLNQIILNG